MDTALASKKAFRVTGSVHDERNRGAMHLRVETTSDGNCVRTWLRPGGPICPGRFYG